MRSVPNSRHTKTFANRDTGQAVLHIITLKLHTNPTNKVLSDKEYIAEAVYNERLDTIVFEISTIVMYKIEKEKIKGDKQRSNEKHGRTTRWLRCFRDSEEDDEINFIITKYRLKVG